MKVPAAVLALTSVVFVGSAFAGSVQMATLKASLNASQQVPPQVHKTLDASGSFKATLRRVGSHGRATLNWRLSVARLSSPVTVAYIDVPQRGRAGEFVVELCIRCATVSSGVTKTLPADVTKAISTRTGFVVIRTKKNPKGEIRGRITVASA